MTQGTHNYVADDRNASVVIDINGDRFPRSDAKISVFDSGFMLGDGVWEGIRLHHGRLAFLDRHLDRLWRGAKAIHMDIGVSREELERRLYAVLDANGMHGDGVHIRLMVTRGLRSTPYQDPRVVVTPATIVVIPEWKEPAPETATRMLKLATVHVRRGYPDVQDPMLNSHSKLNCITACIQAAQAGADEGLMLDPHGFVATCNSTHFFIVKDGEVWTSSGASVPRACARLSPRASLIWFRFSTRSSRYAPNRVASKSGARVPLGSVPSILVRGSTSAIATGASTQSGPGQLGSASR